MSQPLPLISDDELSSNVSDSRAAGEEAGFGSLATARGHLPLLAMDVCGRIDGLLARVTVRQTFVNALDVPVEATYIFPLPDRAAVTRFRMQVAGREVEGTLEERGAAREHYDEAIAAGQRAGIAEEDRPGVFSLRVGNLMPGERAQVELMFCSVLPYHEGEATFRFPLVVAPRYIPGTPLPGPSAGDGTALDTTDVPDASRISPPVLLPGFQSPVRLSLEVELHDGSASAEGVQCSLHAVAEDTRDGYRRIRLYTGERLNRDFILRFRLGGTSIRSTLTLHPDAADGLGGTFALTVVPPATSTVAPAPPRDVIFVLDRSGSMQGWKMVAARRALARMIDSLNDADRFGLIAFDNVAETPPGLPNGLAAATDRQRFRAVEYLATINARGGTEMAGPLDRALALLSSDRGARRDRTLVLITDGQIGNEDQILQTLGTRLKGIRVFTLGIDRAVNEGFLRRLAERGGGTCELVESEDRLDEVSAAIHRRIGTPLLTGLRVSSDELTIEPGEVVPRRLPDLFAGSPVLILGRYRGSPRGAIAIQGADADGHSRSDRIPGQVRDNPAIAAAWARGQIRQLEDRYAAGDGDRSALERTIVAISLKFGVLCRFTAYVAIDRSRTVNEGGRLHRITQPVEQPEGWGALEACESYSPACYSMGPAWLAPERLSFRARRAASPGQGAAASLARSVFGFARALRGGPSPPAPPAGPPMPDEGDATLSLSKEDASDAGLPSDFPGHLERFRQVGSGAMGSIYQAVDSQRSQKVLVRFIPKSFDHEAALARWRRVKEITSKLVHRAFVAIADILVTDSGIWIVLPLVEGPTLAERLQSRGRLDPRDAAALVAELADALQEAHDQGLVHGDLNPPNVALGEHGLPKLLGMGETQHDRTRADGYVGTPGYVPPEWIRGDGDPDDPRADIYGLGVLLYESLTCRAPFSGAGPLEILRSILNDCPQPPRKLVRSVPVALDAICMKAMAKDRADRHQNAAELARALRAFLATPQRKGFWK
jgi:Ca-activated chloride channel family protein